MANFSSETMVARRQMNDIFKVLEKKKKKNKKTKKCQQVKLSFNDEGETKTVIYK